MEQMARHGLLADGWDFQIASFYDEEQREKAGLPKPLGQASNDNYMITIFPLALRLSKHDQKQTVLHEITHALTMHLVGNTEEDHGDTWLSQCGRIMPLSMYMVELFTYRNNDLTPQMTPRYR